MNRKQRRAARKGGHLGQVIYTDQGILNLRDKNYGLPMACYVCTAPHRALNFIRIRAPDEQQYVPLCEACAADMDKAGRDVVRIYLGALDLAIDDGGEAMDEQMEAIAAKLNSTEH
jgi:hypothetical protein